MKTIKHITFLVELVVVGAVAAAQEPAKTMRVDTLLAPYFQFDYNQWIAEHPYSQVISNAQGFSLYEASSMYSGGLLQYNYVDRPTDIYGIEVYGNYFSAFPGCTDLPFFPVDSLFLYEAAPDTFQLLKAVLFDNMDTSHRRGFVSLPRVRHHAHYTSCDSIKDEITQNPMRRWVFLFDKPVTVEDSFYVGGTNYSGEYLRLYMEWYASRDSLPPLPEMNTPGYGLLHPGHFNSDTACTLPLMLKKVKFGAGNSNFAQYYHVGVWEWAYHRQRFFWMIMPIIATYDTIWTIDTPACTPIYNLRQLSRFGNTMTLQWNHDGSHSEWQVSYGPQGIDPDSGTLETCTTARWRYEDTSGVPMVAYVRTVCRELDTLRFSTWSEGLEWYVPQEGVPTASPGSPAAVVLRPNPASALVELAANRRILGVDVYGMDGVLKLKLPQGSAAFDVRGWAEGTYLVVVHTSAGRDTKRLVVR